MAKLLVILKCGNRSVAMVRPIPMGSIRTVLSLILTLTVACADDSSVATTSSCLKAHGAVVDVDREPDRSSESVKRWETEDGCSVRLDFLLSRMGSESCGGEATGDILIDGRLTKELFKDSKDNLTYVRDPENIFGDDLIASSFKEFSQPPPKTVDTGYRQGTQELWLDPSDTDFVYLVDSETAERWPLDPNPSGCL